MSSFLDQLRAKALAQAKALEQAGAVPPAVEKPQTGPQTTVPPAPLPKPAPAPVAPVPTAEPAVPVQAVRPLTGLRLPSAIAPRPAAPPVAPVAPVVAAPDPSPKPAGLQLGSNLARLMAGNAVGPTNVVPAARAALSAPADYEACYSAAEFIEDWNTLEMSGDPTPDEQAEIFRKASARINQLFEHELAGLSISSASEKSITEIAALVNLTFIRVKDAPAAWAVLDRMDKAAVIKGMRATAAKRNSAVKGRKKGEADALSSSFTEAAALTAGFDDEDLGDLGGFDLGF